MSKQHYLRLCSCLILTILGLALGGKIRSQSQAAASSHLKGSATSSKSGNSLTESGVLRANRTLDIALAANPAKAQDFLKEWLLLHPEDMSFVISRLNDEFYDDPDKYYPFLRDFFLGLSKENKALSLSIIAAIVREPRITNLERHLMNNWSEEDAEGLFAHYAKVVEQSKNENTSQMFQLAAIYAHEQAESYSDLLTWASEVHLTGESGRHLQRAIYHALSTHSPEGQRKELLADVMALSETDDRFRSFPAMIISDHAKDKPEEAIAWLKELPAGPWKEQSLHSLLKTTGQTHPLVGADLMNRETFVAEFCSTWEETEDGGIVASDHVPSDEIKQKFYDESLENFLVQAFQSNPEMVLESSEAFYDQELKKNFQAAAREALSGGFTPISAKEESPGTWGPGCTHPEHQH